MQWYHDSGFWTVTGKLPDAADIIAGSEGSHPYLLRIRSLAVFLRIQPSQRLKQRSEWGDHSV